MQQQSQQKKRVPKPKIGIPELLAYNSIGPARKLLLKYGMPDAKDEVDLQKKLTELYTNAKDKVEIEKAFAEIHPHKDFILEYLSPVKTEMPPENIKPITPEPTHSAEGEKLTVDNKAVEIHKHNSVLIASVAIVAIVGLVIYMTKNKIA